MISYFVQLYICYIFDILNQHKIQTTLLGLISHKQALQTNTSIFNVVRFHFRLDLSLKYYFTLWLGKNMISLCTEFYACSNQYIQLILYSWIKNRIHHPRLAADLIFYFKSRIKGQPEYLTNYIQPNWHNPLPISELNLNKSILNVYANQNILETEMFVKF